MFFASANSSVINTERSVQPVRETRSHVKSERSIATKTDKVQVKIRSKSVSQKARSYVRTVAKQVAKRSRAIKNWLWGAGSFQDHYLKRISGICLVTIGLTEKLSRKFSDLRVTQVNGTTRGSIQDQIKNWDELEINKPEKAGVLAGSQVPVTGKATNAHDIVVGQVGPELPEAAQQGGEPEDEQKETAAGILIGNGDGNIPDRAVREGSDNTAHTPRIVKLVIDDELFKRNVDEITNTDTAVCTFWGIPDALRSTLRQGESVIFADNSETDGYSSNEDEKVEWDAIDTRVDLKYMEQNKSCLSDNEYRELRQESAGQFDYSVCFDDSSNSEGIETDDEEDKNKAPKYSNEYMVSMQYIMERGDYALVEKALKDNKDNPASHVFIDKLLEKLFSSDDIEPENRRYFFDLIMNVAPDHDLAQAMAVAVNYFHSDGERYYDMEMILERQPNVNLHKALVTAAQGRIYPRISWLINHGARPGSDLMADEDHTLLERLVKYSYGVELIQQLINVGIRVRDIPLGQKSPFDQTWHGLHVPQGRRSPIEHMKWLFDNRRKIGLDDRRLLRLAICADDIDIAKCLMIGSTIYDLDTLLDDFTHPYGDMCPVSDAMKCEILVLSQKLKDLEACSVFNIILDRYKQMPDANRKMIIKYLQPCEDQSCSVLKQEIKRRVAVRNRISKFNTRLVKFIQSMQTLSLHERETDVDIDNDSSKSTNTVRKMAAWDNPVLKQLLLTHGSDNEDVAP